MSHTTPVPILAHSGGKDLGKTSSYSEGEERLSDHPIDLGFYPNLDQAIASLRHAQFQHYRTLSPDAFGLALEWSQADAYINELNIESPLAMLFLEFNVF